MTPQFGRIVPVQSLLIPMFAPAQPCCAGQLAGQGFSAPAAPASITYAPLSPTFSLGISHTDLLEKTRNSINTHGGAIPEPRH